MKLKDSFHSSSHILVRGLNWIGDAVMSLPTLWHIRENLPETKITVLSPGWCSDIYRICPAVDRVIEPAKSKKKNSIFGEFAIAKLLKDESFDSALILPNSFRSAVSPFLARIHQRYGYKTDGRTMLLTDGIPAVKKDDEHTVLYYQPLLRALGIEWKHGQESFAIEITPEMQAEAEKILKIRGVDTDKDLIGFSPGAAWGPSKRWPASHFSEAARILCQSDSRQALFFGSPGDSELIEKVVDTANTNGVSLAGAFDQLRHLVASISRCRILITNDSGPMHIAAAMGVPVVALFGPTNERVSEPWTGASGKTTILRAENCKPCYNPNCNSDNPCLARISANDVVKSAETLLKGN